MLFPTQHGPEGYGKSLKGLNGVISILKQFLWSQGGGWWEGTKLYRQGEQSRGSCPSDTGMSGQAQGQGGW